ncbi:MAG: hypothetical protein JRF60_10040 [Deltaproteobacteria bacterium]|nr:hypothetical protein [Deltaproteobacteria bacterium]
MRLKVLFQLTGVCIISTLFACSSAMQLAYKKPAATTINKGKLSVIISDQRAPDRGGNNPLVVGIVRNAFGMPFPVKAAPNREPTKVTKELMSECLMAAGYKVVDHSNKTPQLHAVLKVFWSDGYQHSRMGILMPLELKNNEKSPPVWKYSVDVNTGFTVKSAGFRQFNQGYNKMLERTKDKLLELFNSQEFENKYRTLR